LVFYFFEFCPDFLHSSSVKLWFGWFLKFVWLPVRAKSLLSVEVAAAGWWNFWLHQQHLLWFGGFGVCMSLICFFAVSCSLFLVWFLFGSSKKKLCVIAYVLIVFKEPI
jgi:hypothetical protein